MDANKRKVGEGELQKVWYQTRSARVANLLFYFDEGLQEREDLLRDLEERSNWEYSTGALAATSRLKLLEPNDAQTATLIYQLFENPIFILPRTDANGVEEYWDTLVGLATATRDSRLVPAAKYLHRTLLGRSRYWDDDGISNPYTAFSVGTYLRRLLEEFIRQDFASIDLSPEQMMLCEKWELVFVSEIELVAQEKARRADLSANRTRILNAISENPSSKDLAWELFVCVGDDEPEFAQMIALQMARAEEGTPPTDYDLDFIEEHFHLWLPKIAHMIREPEFVHGLLVACIIDGSYGQSIDEHDFSDPAWRDLERVKIADGNWQNLCNDTFVPNELLITLITEHMPALGEIDNVHRDYIPILANKRPAWRRIGFTPSPSEALNIGLRKFPNLSKITMSSYSGRDVFLTARTLNDHALHLEVQIKRLDDELDWRELFGALNATKFVDANFVWFEFVPQRCRFSMSITRSSGRFSVVYFEQIEGPTSISVMLYLLEKISSEGVTEIVWRCPQPPSSRGLRAVQKRMEGFQGLTKVEVPDLAVSEEWERGLVTSSQNLEFYASVRDIELAASLEEPILRSVFEALVFSTAGSKKEAAIYGLCGVATMASVPVLLRLWREEHSEDALGMIALLGAVETIPELVADLSDLGPHYQGLVISALGVLGGEVAANLIVNALETFQGNWAKPSPLRRACLVALLESENKSCLPQIRDRFGNMGFYDATIAGCVLSVGGEKTENIVNGFRSFAERDGKQFMIGRFKLPLAVALGTENTDDTIKEVADGIESWADKEVRVALIHCLIALAEHRTNSRFRVLEEAVRGIVDTWRRDIEFAEYSGFLMRRERWKRKVELLATAWEL